MGSRETPKMLAEQIMLCDLQNLNLLDGGNDDNNLQLTIVVLQLSYTVKND